MLPVKNDCNLIKLQQLGSRLINDPLELERLKQRTKTNDRSTDLFAEGEILSQ